MFLTSPEEVKKTPKKTTIFGFEPNNTKDLEEDANYLCLTSPSSGENTLDLSSLKTELKDRDNNGGLLTVYSAKDYPVFIYFNDNPEINFVSEKFGKDKKIILNQKRRPSFFFFGRIENL